MPVNLAAIINTPEFIAQKKRAAVLLESAYGPKTWWWDTWFKDSRTEAVALLFYTGALSEDGGGNAAPDPRLADARVTLRALLDRLA